VFSTCMLGRLQPKVRHYAPASTWQPLVPF
jgi:hypothetical protein